MLTTVPFKSASGLDTPAGQIMHHGFVALPATASVAEVAGAMRDNKVHAVLITGSDSTALGWVTSRGILRNGARDWTTATSAADAITEPAASVATTATLGDALAAFVAGACSAANARGPEQAGRTMRAIGAPGFEPGTSPTRTERATRLRHAPMPVDYLTMSRRPPGSTERRAR
jgi:CBS domain-containing protein